MNYLFNGLLVRLMLIITWVSVEKGEKVLFFIGKLKFKDYVVLDGIYPKIGYQI